MKNMATLKTFLFCTLIFFYFVAVHSQYIYIYEKGVDSTNQNIIVNKHNYLRRLITKGRIPGQPRAKNLANLQWDSQLAASAQKIANTLKFQHVTVNDPRWFFTGQNLFISYSTDGSRGPNWDQVIQSWFDEHRNFQYPDRSTGETGHYTQVVAGRTKYIGCGYVMFKQNLFNKLYVCNYGPGGNIIGEPPYQI